VGGDFDFVEFGIFLIIDEEPDRILEKEDAKRFKTSNETNYGLEETLDANGGHLWAWILKLRYDICF